MNSLYARVALLLAAALVVFGSVLVVVTQTPPDAARWLEMPGNVLIGAIVVALLAALGVSQIFTQRLTRPADAVDTFEQRGFATPLRMAGADPNGDAAATAEEAAQLEGADLHARLFERLLEAEQIGDDQLLALGSSRAQAISLQLMADGVGTDRIQLNAPTEAAGNPRDVAATIGLSVAREGASAAQSPAAAAALAASAPAPR